jgi:hypothetical protein
MQSQVEGFYDQFSRRFVEDIALRNERIQRQLRSFSNVFHHARRLCL